MTDMDKKEPKGQGGRPTKYTPELIARAELYVDKYVDEGDEIPSIAGLACVLGVRRETLHVWANDKDKALFSNILGNILSLQERVLINKGLSGAFNSNITKLVLGKHGYHEKQDIDQKTQFNVTIGNKDAGSL